LELKRQMALLVPNGPAFAHASDNLGPLAHDGTGFGPQIPVGVSNADGADTAIMSALGHDCEYLFLSVYGVGSSGAAPPALMDLLVDPAGGTSWSTLISDLLVGGNTNTLPNSGGIHPSIFHFPLWVPAGASFGARIRRQSASAITTARAQIVAMGGNKNPAAWWCGQKVESVATFNAAASTGQALTPGLFTVTNAVNNGSGAVRLTISNPDGLPALTTGESVTVLSVSGTAGHATSVNGTWTITVINSTTIDLDGSTIVGTYSSDGVVGRNPITDFSAWHNLGSPIAARAGAAQWRVGGVVVGAAQAGITYDVEFGAGGHRIGPRVYQAMSNFETAYGFYRGPIFCDIPAGTQLQVRSQSSTISGGTSQITHDVAAYLVQ
jgi:hypothetical protein